MPEPQETNSFEAKDKEVEEKILFSWQAKSRPFKRRSREFYVTVISIASVVGFIIFLIEGIMPVILLASLVFLFYILNTVEPGSVEYILTNKGIKIGDKQTSWEMVTRFWFTEKLESSTVIFETIGFPGRLELVVNKQDVDKIKDLVTEYVPEEKAPPNLLDKTSGWITSKLPQS